MTSRLAALALVLAPLMAHALDADLDCAVPAVAAPRFPLYASAYKSYVLAVAGSAVDTGVPLATTTTYGDLKLAGDLGGTAASPTVVGLTNVTGLTTGSVVFVGASNTGLTQNNANFFWDATNTQLGIGTASPNGLVGGVLPGMAIDGGAAGVVYRPLVIRNSSAGGSTFALFQNDLGAAHGLNFGIYGSTFGSGLSDFATVITQSSSAGIFIDAQSGSGVLNFATGGGAITNTALQLDSSGNLNYRIAPASVSTTPGTSATATTVTQQAGGATTSTAATTQGGAGALLTIQGSVGGAASGASATSNTGGVGGGITINCGNGGAATNSSTNNIGGAGGSCNITAGNAGAGAQGNVNGGNIVLTAGSKTGTGTAGTIQTASVLAVNAGVTASGSVANDFSGGTGPFKTSTGAGTFGGSSNTFNGAAPQITAGVSATTTGAIKLFNSGAATGAVTIQSGATVAGNYTLTLPATGGSAGQYLKTDGSGGLGYVGTEHDFSAFSSATALAAGSAFHRTLVTNASTLTSDSVIVIDVAGTGTGPLVAKLCSDGTTCGAGNVYLTCTVSGADCTAVAGTITACTVTKSAVAAATTLTWSVTTACGTTDPAFNVNAHMTTP